MATVIQDTLVSAQAPTAAVPFMQTFIVGDGSTLSFNIPHGLNTLKVTPYVYDLLGTQYGYLGSSTSSGVTIPDAAHVTLTFNTAPAANSIEVDISGVPNA